MLVVPIKDSIVYIQPLYLQAEQTAIPELTRVIVVYADKVEMERTLEAALLKVFGQESSATTGTAGAGSGDTGAGGADAAAARKLFTEAVDAQKKGDWALYGTKLSQLGALLERLAASESTATK